MHKIKKIILITFAFLLSLKSMSQKSIVSGTVTYFFNDYQGDKPDIGSKVFIFPSTMLNTKTLYDSLVKEYDLKSIKNSQEYIISSKKIRLQEYLKHKKKYSAEIKEIEQEILDYSNRYNSNLDSIKKYGFDKSEKTEDMDTRFYLSIMPIEVDDNTKLTKTTTVDATGRFTIKITPGKYFVFIRSNNRKGLKLSTVSGKCYLKLIDISENDEISIDHKFELDSFN